MDARGLEDTGSSSLVLLVPLQYTGLFSVGFLLQKTRDPHCHGQRTYHVSCPTARKVHVPAQG